MIETRVDGSAFDGEVRRRGYSLRWGLILDSGRMTFKSEHVYTSQHLGQDFERNISCTSTRGNFGSALKNIFLRSESKELM